tara:strand:- start:911 stop:1369 length:459 start_codon:yes stop_codon:yes gene_type:complete
MEFEESLVSGQKSESIVLDIIKKKYPKAYIMEGYHKEYDIMIPEINETVEVKKDFKSKYTGNIVVEIEMNNRPSGLSTTTANWWVFHISEEELIWMTPDIIKEMIEEESFDPVEFTGKGDKISKMAYLIPKINFYLYCNKVVLLKDKRDKLL